MLEGASIMYPNDTLWRFTESANFSSIFAENPSLAVITILGTFASLIGVLLILRRALGTRLLRSFITLGFLVAIVAAGALIRETREIDITRRIAYESAASSFGMSKDSIHYTVVLQENGSAACETRYTIGAYSYPALSVEEKYLIVANPADISIANGIEIPKRSIKCDDGKRSLVIERERKVGCELQVVYKISPSLPAGKKAVLEEPIIQVLPEGAFAMDAAALEKSQLPYEFIAMRMTYPSNHLTVEAVLPKGFMPGRSGLQVWYGPGQTDHVSERVKLESGGEGVFERTLDQETGCMHLMLRVDYPLHGATYAITWNPPTAG
jgi:hypothetical protein